MLSDLIRGKKKVLFIKALTTHPPPHRMPRVQPLNAQERYKVSKMQTPHSLRHTLTPDLMTEDISYKVIKLIEQDPEISQRELSRQLGVSLGKVNYCLHALIDKGWVKARNFKNSQNKLAYRYLLTPQGVQQKTVVAASFLKRKLAEYESLQREIEGLRQEVERSRNETV